MGYNTEFSGELLFKNPLSETEIDYMESFFWIELHIENEGKIYVNLEFNEDWTGLRWDGSEKTRLLEESINHIIEKMRDNFIDFELTGEIKAQGEEIGDLYIIKIENNRAVRVNFTHTCPSCGHEFREE